MAKNEYFIEIYIYIGKEVILSALAGNNLMDLKREIMPTVKKECKKKGYTDKTVFVEYFIDKNEEYFDSDEDYVSLAD